MIPNEVNEENSRNNFVQIKLGELCEEKELTISDIVEQPKRKTQNLSELDEETSQILEKYNQYLNLNYRKKTTIQNYYYHVRKFLQWMNKSVNRIA
jgi:hypothetical protein